MKLSKLFHTLYAFIMAIPLIIVPLYAIYLQNHTPESITIETEKNQVVDFNQIGNNGTFDNQWFKSQYVVPTYNDNYVDVEINNVQVTQNQLYLPSLIRPTVNDIYVIKYNFTLYEGSLTFGSGYGGNYSTGDTTATLNTNQEYSRRFKANTNDLYQYIYFYGQSGKAYISNFMIFNLTQMYGSGNEPTLQVFNETFNNSYYPYTESQKMIVNVGTNTFDDTDIGSQFVYNLYNVVDKYFNWSNAMGLNNLYDWFVVNVFSAANPLIFAVIFNLLVYWLFVSLFWLIFDVLMYVPNMIHKMLDKARLE